MTDERSLERAARSFLEPGPTRAPEAAVEAALELIQTTPQERDLRIPRRFAQMSTPARVAAAAVFGVLALGGAFLLGRPSQSTVGGPSPSLPAPSVPVASAPSTRPSPASPAPTDYSALPGRILVEHLGNALDLSEATATDYNPDKRRFYFMDPSDMTARTVTEFLKGKPVTGKSAADISSDQKRIVFQDWTDQTRLFEANLDGTGFRKIPLECTCALLYPDYDPTASKIVYTRIQGGQSWLEILDLATNATTRLESTLGSSEDDVPEQPAWSPDGKTIAFSSLHWAGRNDPVVGTVRYGSNPPASGKLMLLDVASGTVTTVTLPAGELPGDVNWSPDSTTLVYTSGPASTTGSTGGMPANGGVRFVRTDGTGFRKFVGWGSPTYLPDGKHILFQDNTFWLMDPDGTNAKPVNAGSMDLSDLGQGFSYVAHWIPDAPETSVAPRQAP